MFFGTLLSLIIALLCYHYTPNDIHQEQWSQIAFLLMGLSSLFFLIFTYVHTSTWRPLQGAEKNFTPRVTELFHQDRFIKITSASLELLPLVAFFIAFVLIIIDTSQRLNLLLLWVVLFGVTIDLTRMLIRRIQTYLNPFGVIELMTQAAKASVRNEKELELCDWIDGLTEIALKSILRSNTSLGCLAINELHVIANNFLTSSKSLSHHAQDAQSKQLGIQDKISYTLFYMYQRLEIINAKAVEHHLEPVCNSIIATLSKISIYSAKFDISLTSYPIHYLGKCAISCQQHQMPEVGIKAILSLLEVAKTITHDVDLNYQQIKDCFFSLIAQMHEMTKEVFKQDKEARIDLLMQPFKNLKDLLSTEKLANHPDIPEILSKLNNVLAEFVALEMVLKTLPPIPQIPEDQIPPEVSKLT
jgi:hypothetical protein